MATITITTTNDEGEEVTLRLPAINEVCGRCDGEGRHVNPSIDGNGITQSDREDWADDDFMEDYVNGVYDVTCEECDGRNVIPVVDEKRADPEQLRLYREHLQAEADYYAEVAAERRYLGYI